MNAEEKILFAEEVVANPGGAESALHWLKKCMADMTEAYRSNVPVEVGARKFFDDRLGHFLLDWSFELRSDLNVRED